MAVTFCCGAECRIAILGASTTPNERHWDPGNGTAAISTTTVRTGSAAFRCNAAGATVSIDRIIARTVVSGRTYVRFASLPGSTTQFIRANNANGNMDINVSSAGDITCQAGAGAASASAGTVTTGVWYRIDWLFDTSTGTASAKVRLATGDGASGTEQTSTNAQASVNMTGISWGPRGAVTCDAFFDDIITGDDTGDYPFGSGTVESMSPTRDGTHSFTLGDFGDTAGTNIATSATTVWQLLDDADLTSTSDFVQQKVIRTTGYVQVGFGTPPHAWDAQAVNVVMSWHAAGTGADTMGAKMNDNGTLRDLTNEGGGTNPGLLDVSQTTHINSEKLVLVAPSTSAAWTNTRLSAVMIRVGYSGDVNAIPFCDGVMLEVAYGDAPAAAAQVPYTNPMPPLIAQ